jgi:Cu+-exporting ATPase
MTGSILRVGGGYGIRDVHNLSNARAYRKHVRMVCRNKRLFEKVTDPVCLAIVDEEDAKFTSMYKDQKYYFCCNWCKKKFEENPKRYSRISTDFSVDLKHVT